MDKRFKDIRVLVADDHDLNRDYLAGLLRHQGAIVDVAEDGVAALHCALNNSYHLVVLDVRMPGLTGYEVMVELRKHHDHPNQNAAFVAVTADTQPADRERLLANGFIAYLGKPVPSEVLLQCLRGTVAQELGVDPPLDRASGLASSGGNEQIWLELLRMVDLQLPQLVGQVKAQVLERNYGAARDAAHKLRGAAQLIGGRALNESAGGLEAHLTMIPVRHVPDFLLTNLERAAEDLSAAIARLLNGQSDNG